MLNKPAAVWIARFHDGIRFENENGKLINIDTKPMLITVPSPNTKMYEIPAAVD